MANLSDLMSETTKSMGGSPMGVQSSDTVPNAETDGTTFFYNPRFISQLESSAGVDGVRFVIAHELGHQVNGMSMGGHDGEFAADAFAARALASAGASFDAITGVMGYLSPESNATHPGSGTRMARAHAAFQNQRAEDAELGVDKPTKTVDVDLDLMI